MLRTHGSGKGGCFEGFREAMVANMARHTRGFVLGLRRAFNQGPLFSGSWGLGAWATAEAQARAPAVGGWWLPGQRLNINTQLLIPDRSLPQSTLLQLHPCILIPLSSTPRLSQYAQNVCTDGPLTKLRLPAPEAVHQDALFLSCTSP